MAAESTGRTTLEVQSFRVVFALERRIHRIDRWRLPLPYGVPVRALAYAAAVLLAVVLAALLPGIGPLLTVLPAPARYVLLPGLAAFALDRARVDGRPAHNFVIALLRHRLGARQLSAFRTAAPIGHEYRLVDDIPFVPDDTTGTDRPARVRGPARLRLTYATTATRRRRRLVLEQTSTKPLHRPRLLTIPAGAEVELR